jgi:glutamate synthase (NADPH/NADH) small chain
VLATQRTGKRVAVVGSGPAGLAAAQELARLGHSVEVFEKQDRIGGLLRYGIPDFKLDKVWIDRRLDQLRAEGVKFHTQVALGKDIALDQLTNSFDAVILAMGASRPRDTRRDGQLLQGRQLTNIHFAMDFLEGANRAVADGVEPAISAKGKRVVVLGGGDTGSDCVGTALRQGAESIVNIELFAAPPRERSEKTPGPAWPAQLRTSSSHEEAAHFAHIDIRRYSLETLRFIDNGAGAVGALEAQPVQFVEGALRADGAPERIEADVVLLAMGFVGVDASGAEALSLDARGSFAANDFQTSNARVFACGDARRGQSLVVWAIAEGRECAAAVHRQLGA